MSLGGGYQQSKSSNESESAGPLGTGPKRELFQRNLLMNLLGPDWTAGNGGLFGQLQARTAAPTNYQTPQLTSTGLLQEQEAGLKQPFEQAVAQAMSRASGNFAGRGFLRPENIQAIAGSAAQNVAPGFANLMTTLAGQNVGQRTQAPLIQEDIMRNRFADLMNALGLGSQLLGGTARGSGGGSSFGVQAQVGGGKSGGGGGGDDE